MIAELVCVVALTVCPRPPVSPVTADWVPEVEDISILVTEAHTMSLEGWHASDELAVVRAVNATFPVEERAHAMEIAYCESRFRPGKIGSLGERGVMQIHPVHIDFLYNIGYTWNQMLEVTPNVKVAYEIWELYGWEPWACVSELR